MQNYPGILTVSNGKSSDDHLFGSHMAGSNAICLFEDTDEVRGALKSARNGYFGHLLRSGFQQRVCIRQSLLIDPPAG
jgi:hypothetical protein